MIRQGLKVAMMGAGGTGKTTDVSALAMALKIPMIKSVSRVAYERRNLSEKDFLKITDKEKWEFQSEIFNAKQELDDNTYEFISDRTMLDHWAYCLMYCSPFIPTEDFYKYENTVRKHMKSTYTYMFYYPWGYWTPENEDGVRQVAPGWQSAIDAIIVGYCNRWKLPVITVPQMQGPELRQEFIKKIILSRGNQ